MPGEKRGECEEEKTVCPAIVLHMMAVVCAILLSAHSGHGLLLKASFNCLFSPG